MNKDFDRFPFTLKEETALPFLTKAYKKEAGIEEVDEAAADHINQMCQWLCNSDKWGVFLMGSVGNGKTTLMNATVNLLQVAYTNSLKGNGANGKASVQNLAAKEITAAARKGNDVYDYWTQVFAIDDLGEEPKEVMSFGNTITPVIDIIEERYKRRRITLITTNLDRTALQNKYGARVTDRLREMMQVISFTNPSYRK